MSDLTGLTLLETLDGLKKKEFSEEELNVDYEKRMYQFNPKLNAYLHIVEGIHGIPAAIKDIICTLGFPTTAGSKILSNFIPPYDATVISNLKKQGIRVIGKTNLDEFAMGSSGENSAYEITKNPWDITKVPGGSSSGSAVAVSADLCVFSLGTDTGGSIRQPASLCGVVGVKPSYGRVSRYGAIAMASSLDQIGPLTKSVADARKVLEWISGPDSYDSNCHPEIFSGSKEKVLKQVQHDRLDGVRVGIPKEYFGEGLDKGVEKVIKEAIKKLEGLGAKIVDISLPHTEYAIAAYYIIMPSEVSSNLARFTGIRYGKSRDQFGAEPKRRIMLGTHALSSGYFDDYYAKAAKVRTLIKQDFNKAFDPSTGSGCDVLVGPVSPTVAWNLGEKVNDPLKMYLSDAYTIPASLAGIPSVSVPCGFSDGLPVGLQILGKYMDEETILNVAEIYEQNTSWHKERPKL